MFGYSKMKKRKFFDQYGCMHSNPITLLPQQLENSNRSLKAHLLLFDDIIYIFQS